MFTIFADKTEGRHHVFIIEVDLKLGPRRRQSQPFNQSFVVSNQISKYRGSRAAKRPQNFIVSREVWINFARVLRIIGQVRIVHDVFSKDI